MGKFKNWKMEIKRSFRYHIKTHALQRFRERVEPQFRFRSDEDLARLFDERIHAAIESRRFMDVIDRDNDAETTRVAIFESQEGEEFYVPMRRHHVELAGGRPGATMFGPDISGYAAITCLTKDMAHTNLAQKNWVLVTKEGGTTLPKTAKPFTALAVVKSASPVNEQAAEVVKEPDSPAPPAPAVEEQRRTNPKVAASLAALPEGWKKAENREERRAWVTSHFMNNPTATIKGCLIEARAHFGVGVKEREISEIRLEVNQYLARIGRESIAGSQAAAAAAPHPVVDPAALHLPTAPRPAPVLTIAPPAPPAQPVRNTDMIAAEYAKAAAEEKVHRGRVEQALAVVAAAQAALEAERATHLERKGRVAQLLAELTADAGA